MGATDDLYTKTTKTKTVWDALWDRQAKQQVDLGLDPETMSDAELERAAKDLALGLFEEAADFARDATRYKKHLLSFRSPMERANILESGVDVLKYTMALLQLRGIAADEVRTAFMEKSRVVQDKAEGAAVELKSTTRLIISDLDNCIADLSVFQTRLTDAQDGRPMNDEVLKEIENLKEEFYRGGGFRDLAPLPGAREALERLRTAGYSIAIITARPHHQYKRVYGDTLFWLKQHNIPYDLLLFNKDKAEAVYEHILPARPKFFIEDRSKHCMELIGIGVPVLLMDKPWNQDMPNHALVTRVKDWNEVTRVAPAYAGDQDLVEAMGG